MERNGGVFYIGALYLAGYLFFLFTAVSWSVILTTEVLQKGR
jgi:hypothetical protein